MDDVLPFGTLVAALSLAGLLAVWSNRVSERIRIPAPAIFLVVAAVASDLFPQLADIPVLTVQRVVTVMLVLLLFDGGMHIGLRRFRTATGSVLLVGVGLMGSVNLPLREATSMAAMIGGCHGYLHRLEVGTAEAVWFGLGAVVTAGALMTVGVAVAMREPRAG